MGRIIEAIRNYVGNFLACATPEEYARRFGITYDEPKEVAQLFGPPMAHFLGPPVFEGESVKGTARIKFGRYAGCVDEVRVSLIQA